MFRLKVRSLLASMLFVAAFAFSANANSTLAAQVVWEVKLHSNPRYLEVKIDTKSFPPNTCFDNVSVAISFYDAAGRVKHRKDFRLASDIRMRQGNVYVDWVSHPFRDARSVKGDNVYYKPAACGDRYTRLHCDRNVFEKILGIGKCDKEKEIDEGALQIIVDDKGSLAGVAHRDEIRVRGSASTAVTSDTQSITPLNPAPS